MFPYTACRMSIVEPDTIEEFHPSLAMAVHVVRDHPDRHGVHASTELATESAIHIVAIGMEWHKTEDLL